MMCLRVAAVKLAIVVGVGVVPLAIARPALSQSSSSTTTTTTTTPVIVVPELVTPPSGSLSVNRTEKTTNPDGSQTTRDQSTFRNNSGVASESTTTTTAPTAPAVTIERSTSTSKVRE